MVTWVQVKLGNNCENHFTALTRAELASVLFCNLIPKGKTSREGRGLRSGDLNLETGKGRMNKTDGFLLGMRGQLGTLPTEQMLH